MRTALLATLVLAACSNSKSDAPGVSAAGSAAVATAGKVVEVTGAVTVAGKPLKAGDSVGATDTVDTGADGSVAIELAHNGVRLVLGANKHVRINESLAWTQPKKVEAADQDVATASAGRPAERTAADTAVTGANEAAKQPEAPGAAPSPRAEVTAAPPAPPPPPKAASKKVAPSDDEKAMKGLTGIGAGGGGVGDGAGIGTIGHGAGTGASAGAMGGRQGPEATVTTDTPTVQGGLDVAIVRRIVKQHVSQLRYCYEMGLQRNPSLAGKVILKLAIDGAGKVVSAEQTDGSTLTDKDVGSCIVQRAQSWEFPMHTGGGVVVVSYPFTFSVN